MNVYIPPMPQIDGHQMKTRLSVRGVRDRGRGGRRGREQGRGEGRGRSGMGGHGNGCNEGNGWEFVDGVMGENVAGNGVVDSVSGGVVNAKGVGGGESGGSSSTITQEKQKLINKVQVVGARRVWGMMKVTTTSSLKSTLLKFCPPTSLQIKRKTVLDIAGNVRRWWFVIHASENLLLDLEGRWDQLQFQTGWKLEPCFKPVDSVTSNVDPQTSLDDNAVTPALDLDTNQASPEFVQDHDNNQVSLESCQTFPFLGN